MLFIRILSLVLVVHGVVSTFSCLQAVINKYFEQQRTLNIFIFKYISIDEIEMDVFKNWSVKIKDFETFGVDFNEKYKKNAIIIAEDLKQLLNFEVQISKLNLWNSKSYFVFYTQKNDTDGTLSDFVKILWSNYIINVIIINGNDILSYFPYKNGSCGDTTIQWIGSCEEIPATRDSYPDKIPGDFQSCPIYIRVIPWPPFSLLPKEIKNYSDVDFKDGIEIKLTQTIAQMLNLRVVYSTSSTPQDWGLVLPNGTGTGAMRHLLNKDVDLAIGAIGPSLERHRYLDYSSCHFQESLTCCVPKAQLLPKWRSLLDIFHFNAWLAMILTYGIVSFVLWFACFCLPKDTTGYSKLNNSFSNIFSVFLAISAKETPRKRSGRIIFVVWIIFGLHCIISYQAKLISVLTHPSYEKQMNSVEEMLNSDISLVLLTTIRRFFANSDDWRVQKILKNWKSCLDSDKCLSQVAYQRDIAFFTTKVHMEFETLKYIDTDGNPLIYCFEESYLTYPSEIFMTRGFPLREKFNELIVRIRDAGLLFKWHVDIKRIWRAKYALRTVSSSENSKPLTLSHLQGAFFVSAIGWSVSAIVFFAELFTHRIFKW